MTPRAQHVIRLTLPEERSLKTFAGVAIATFMSVLVWVLVFIHSVAVTVSITLACFFPTS